MPNIFPLLAILLLGLLVFVIIRRHEMGQGEPARVRKTFVILGTVFALNVVTFVTMAMSEHQAWSAMDWTWAGVAVGSAATLALFSFRIAYRAHRHYVDSGG